MTVAVSASWDGGYVAQVQVVNKGKKAGAWQVTVSNPDTRDLRLLGTWNASGSQNGTTFTFAGDSLAAGGTASFGYQAGARSRGGLRPTGCSVSGGSCSVR